MSKITTHTGETINVCSYNNNLLGHSDKMNVLLWHTFNFSFAAISLAAETVNSINTT